MGTTLSIGLSGADRSYLEGLLPDQKQIRSALYQTVSRTTRTLAAKSRRIIKQGTNLDQKGGIDSIKPVVTGSRDNPVGEIRFSGKSVPLSRYHPKYSKRGGVSVTPTKGKQTITLRHAFKATVGNGHVGYFVRAKIGGATASAIQEQGLKGGNFISASRAQSLAGKYGINPTGRLRALVRVTPAGYAERLPIQELFGPPLSSVAQTDVILKPLEEQARGLLLKNMQSQIDRFLKK